MSRLVPLFLSIVATACATPVVSPADIRVAESSFGIYSLNGDEALDLLESTTVVPCALGTVFGAQVEIQFESRSRVILPVQGTWVRPAISEGWTSTSGFLPEPFELPPINYDLGLDAVNQLSRQELLIPGDYTLRFYDPTGDRVYYEKTFVVSDCP